MNQTNLLSIPAYVIGVIGLLATCYLSEVINSRVLSTIILQFWALPLLIVLYTFTEATSQWSYFVVVSLLVGFPYVHPIQVAWTSRNSNSVRTRTVSACMYNVSLQAGYIIAVSEHSLTCWYARVLTNCQANIYQEDDRPLCGSSFGRTELFY
jgi:predicted MFS family arabinose efflux permease